MTFEATQSEAQKYGLAIYGGFHGGTSDGLHRDHQSLLMLGPGRQFWPQIKTAPEYNDGLPNPIDRWSARILSLLADTLNATPFLPFTGPPYTPFLAWALKTNRAWISPVGMLVHDTAGLMVSYRGALGFVERLNLPKTGTIPCDGCSRPCLTACPVNALEAQSGYKTEACHGHLNTSDGKDCLSRGCLVRRACPHSVGANRSPEQSAHHMAYFHPESRTP